MITKQRFFNGANDARGFGFFRAVVYGSVAHLPSRI
uniref:Uncharacterized protein n=1 Tax=Setaria italica TaxID=4555 RepID=K4ANB1_SETIT